MTPDDRAKRAADALLANDEATKWFGMNVVSVTEGQATLTMVVQPHHCNGHGTCHGGVLFSLADSAFAFACNSRNQATVAQHAQISFIAPGKAGDLLTAEAREVSKKGKSGIYDIRVTGPGGVVAEFRGMSRAIRGNLFEEVT